MSMENRIMELIASKCGKDVTVERIDVVKNNGVVRTGFNIKEVGSTLAPTIYFNTEADEDGIVEHVVEVYSNTIKNPQPDFDFSKIMTNDYILSNVKPVLANSERNKNTDIVKHDFISDLIITYRVDVDTFGTMVITPKHLKYLGISEEELYESAMKNIQGVGIIQNMSDALSELGGDNIPDTPLLVITNKDITYGASCILDNDVIETLSKFCFDFYIIPSSVHELIACPITEDGDEEYLIDLIKLVNANEVRDIDYLSDNLFKLCDGKLEQVKTKEVM